MGLAHHEPVQLGTMNIDRGPCVFLRALEGHPPIGWEGTMELLGHWVRFSIARAPPNWWVFGFSSIPQKMVPSKRDTPK